MSTRLNFRRRRESVSARDRQRDGPVFRPTTAGIRFLLLLAVMAFAAYNTRNNLLYLMFSVSLATLAVAAVAGRRSLRAIVAETGRMGDRFAGVVSHETLQLRNTSAWIGCYGIEVEDLEFPGPRPKASLPHLGRGECASVSVESRYPRRGVYHGLRIRLTTEFPFGLFRIGRRFELARRFTVYPRIEGVNITFVFRGRAGQVPERYRGGESEELLRLRDYAFGDGFHHIHWKATAKVGRLMVRELADHQQKRFTLVLDNATDSHRKQRENEDDFEKGVSLVASVASHLASHGLPHRLVSVDEVFPYGSGPEHLRGILTYLATVAPSHRPKVNVLSWAAEALAQDDVVLVHSLRSGERWTSLASPSLHFISANESTNHGSTFGAP